MTTFRQYHRVEHCRHDPLFPLCGKRRDHFGHEWTPAAIQRHEAGCHKCQRLLDLAEARRQSEHARLIWSRDDEYLEEVPFSGE